MIDAANVEVRTATLADLETVARFDATDDRTVMGYRRHDDFLKGLIGSGAIWLASQDDRDIGYCRIDFVWPERVPLLSWMYVEPECRNSGVAMRIKAHVCSALQAQGYGAALVTGSSLRPEHLMKLARHYPAAGELTFLDATIQYFFWHRLDEAQPK